MGIEESLELQSGRWTEVPKITYFAHEGPLPQQAKPHL
jgi:hypothetical protein